MHKFRDIVDDVLALDPGAPAIEYDRAWWTWGDIKGSIVRLDEILEQLSFGECARIGLLMRNRPEMAGPIIAIVGRRRCLVVLNASAPDDRLAAEIRTVKTPVMIGMETDMRRIQARAAMQEMGMLGIELLGRSDPPMRRARDLQYRSLQVQNLTSLGVAMEMLTSGTTGPPKRVALKSENLEKTILGQAVFEKGRSAADAPRLRSGTQIISAPLSHIAGFGALMNCIVAGRAVCLLEKFTVDEFLSAIDRHRPKVVSAPPAAIKMIMDADVPRERLSGLKALRTGTAPLDPNLFDAFRERYGIPILQNYGATEFGGGIAGWTLGDFDLLWSKKVGSVGRLNPGVEGRVVDEGSDTPLPAGEQGVLELRGQALGDGQSWIRTTDLAIVDEDQFLWIKGRSDNAIIRGGFKIHPDEIANALRQHPAIADACVVGVPNERLGNVPAAACVLKRGVPPASPSELKTFLKERLLSYQVPVSILLMDEFPRTPSLKVDQSAVREILITASATS